MIAGALCAEIPYRTGLGGRSELSHGDGLVGPDYRFFLNSSSAVEFFALTDFTNGIELYGLFELSGRLPGVPSKFYWYAGGGAHAGTWKGYDDKKVAGVDGIAGVEYCFDKIPLSLSADWHPLFNIVTDKKRDRFWPLKFGLSARYMIR